VQRPTRKTHRPTSQRFQGTSATAQPTASRVSGQGWFSNTTRPCPSWEILSPTSLKPHGVGTIFPFEINGILEIPVSLPQDHQLIRVAGQRPSAAVDTLLRLSTWIRGLADRASCSCIQTTNLVCQRITPSILDSSRILQGPGV